MTPEQKALRSAQAQARLEAMQDDTAASHAAGDASRARARAFNSAPRPCPTVATAPAPVAPSSADEYPEEIRGFLLASETGVYLPDSAFSGEAARLSRDAFAEEIQGRDEARASIPALRAAADAADAALADAIARKARKVACVRREAKRARKALDTAIATAGARAYFFAGPADAKGAGSPVAPRGVQRLRRMF